MASEILVNKLKLVLKEIFQFDNNDLDFGIYRILNMKKNEIRDFIEKELFEIIEKEVKTLEDSQILREKLEILLKDIETLFGCSLEEAKEKNAQAPKIKEYSSIEEQLQSSEKESEMEEELYNHIINFFSRYYDNGDFISKRRYSKKNKYAIPYNGEEVYLYWANHDQYYIKTSENFKNYLFKVDDVTVEFTVSNDGVELEKGNIKDIDKKFFIYHDLNYQQSKKTLTIQFSYRGLTEEEENAIKKEVDKKTIKKEYIDIHNFTAISGRLEVTMIPKLKEKHIKIDGEPSELSELKWHLNKYTTKNTSDYFIHKDLKGFLRKELDFYIKNEMFHIDDLESKEKVSVNLLGIKAFKAISLKIIEFLAQIEEFQKKLWEKKNFVISTNYCITLDYIDQKYYPQILANKEQLEEWKDYFNFDLKKELNVSKGELTSFLGQKSMNIIDILKSNPTLVIDTKYFDNRFKSKIISEIDNLDENTNGLLINSDNFHALNLLFEKYHGKVKSFYIDPPYNAQSSEIIYKNNFKHSSWITLMENRISLAKEFLNESGVFIVAIDENEQEKLGLLLRNLFPNHQMTCITVIHNPSGQQGQNFSYCHEYAYFIYPRNDRFIGTEIRDENIDIRNLRDVTGEESLRESAKNCFYPIFVKDGKITGFGEVCDEDFHPKSPNVLRNNGIIEVYPLDPQNIERKWRFARQSVDKIKTQLKAHYIKRRKIWDIKRIKSEFNYKTVWTDSKYFANNHGTQVLNNILGENLFSYPKSIYTVYDSVKASTINSDNSLVFDFFAGSGTTGHAVLKLNREENLNLKFILVEMGQYFDSVLKHRIKKNIFSDNWRNGKPLDNDGSRKQIIKYQILEQYEDSLHNIVFNEANSKVINSKNYNIKYMLDFESKNSNTFLNIDLIEDPFEYKLKIEDNNEINEVSVDLIETFNYIAGICVNSTYMKKENEIKYIFIKGHREEIPVLVVWRNKPDSFSPELDKEFVEKEIGNDEYDEILVNGNSLITNAKSIDEIFKDSMFR